MKNMGIIADLMLRFLLGGAAVAGCYLLLLVVPWKSFAGIFAAFPAVLASAVIMTGHYDGNKAASQLALGATAGMLGCTVCVAVTLWGLLAGWGWLGSLIISIPAWLISSMFLSASLRSIVKVRGFALILLLLH